VSELDALYLELLRYGLLLLRDAVWLGDVEWAKAETQHLHEIPTLIGDDNVHRHVDYMQRIRVDYVKFVKGSDRPELNTGVATYYYPVWRQMTALMCRHAEEAKRRGLSEYTPFPLPPGIPPGADGGPNAERRGSL
jgi:hypothetical protein